MLALNIVPDSWQAGWLNEIIMIGAVLAALGVIVKVAVLPVFRWLRNFALAFETAVDRLATVPRHDDRLDVIEQRLGDIHEALRPTNGDRRSISDRLDTVKAQTLTNSTEIRELKVRVDSLIEGNPA